MLETATTSWANLLPEDLLYRCDRTQKKTEIEINKIHLFGKFILNMSTYRFYCPSDPGTNRTHRAIYKPFWLKLNKK